MFACLCMVFHARAVRMPLHERMHLTGRVVYILVQQSACLSTHKCLQVGDGVSQGPWPKGAGSRSHARRLSAPQWSRPGTARL